MIRNDKRFLSLFVQRKWGITDQQDKMRWKRLQAVHSGPVVLTNDHQDCFCGPLQNVFVQAQYLNGKNVTIAMLDLIQFQKKKTSVKNSPHLWSTRLICVSRDLPFSKGSTRYLDASTIEGTPLLGGARGWLIDVDTSAQTPRSRSVHDLEKWMDKLVTIGATFSWS